MPAGGVLKTRLSTKGQVILPKGVRERLGWAAGTVLEIEDRPDGVTLKASKREPVFPPTRLEDVAGMLAHLYTGPPKTIAEMNAAVDEDFRQRHARGRY